MFSHTQCEVVNANPAFLAVLQKPFSSCPRRPVECAGMEFPFSEPWHSCDDEYFEEELRREICEKHVLFGIEAKIIARRQDCDDFLFALPNGRFAGVHLTWSKESNPTWPGTTIYDSAEQMWMAIQDDIDDWKWSESFEQP
jgi:hypothetical protein